MKIKTTIAILTHNRSWHFAQCIASIRQFTRVPYVVKVLDVKSDLNHVEHVKQFEGPDCIIKYEDEFLSCLGGRREFLKLVDTEFVVYLDDDIRVGPHWLGNLLRPMRKDPKAGAVPANLIQEATQTMSGVRYLEQKGTAQAVRQYPVNYEGQGELCCGGATAYRLEALKQTEMRLEFSGGYEDWDQTLQMTKDLGWNIYGSRATVFHRHMAECLEYFDSRWRWRELLEGALGMWDHWKIRTGVDKVMKHYLKNEIVIPRELAERMIEVIT